MSALIKLKLNLEITWAWNQKILISRSSYRMVSRRATRGEKDQKTSPGLFWKSEKNCPDILKNALTVSIFELNFLSKCSFKVSRRKNSQNFPCGAFFSAVFNKMFIKVPKSHEASPALKSFWLCTWFHSV